MIGRTTEEQMHIGIYWGYVAMMEGLVARMKAEIGRPVKVIATGGLATLFDTHTDIFDAIEGDLTIQGLAMLYARSQGRRLSVIARSGATRQSSGPGIASLRSQ